MDGADNELLKSIRFAESKLVTEPLSTDPELIPISDINRRKIRFGNTGFRVGCDMYPNRYASYFDFEPEDKSFPTVINNPKHLSILGSSFLKLHELLNNEPQLNEWGLESKKITTLTAITNHTLVSAISRMFGENGHPEIVEARDQNTFIVLDLEKFKNLKNGDPLLTYLGRLSDRTKGQTVTYQKTIGTEFK